MKCVFIKPDGTTCKANSMRDADYCFRHNPKTKNIASKASETGGLNRKRFVAFQEELRINSTKDLERFLTKVINGVWQGKIPTKVGSSLGFLARCWLDAYEKSSLEQRIEELEKNV